MRPSTLHRVDARRVDAAVTEDIRKANDVMLDTVIQSGKQMSQVMWKYFLSAHFRGVAEFFHFCPYIAAIQKLPAGRDKYTSVADPLLFCIF